MNELKLPKSVKSITFIKSEPQPSEATPTATVFRAEKKSKKQTRGLREFGKWTRRSTEAIEAFSTTYLRRHEKSNAEKRDGWLRDYNFNILKANRAALKKLRLRLFRI